MHKERLVEGSYHHIYNRGINGEDIFKETRNYHYFLEKYIEYIEPIAATFSYCLLPNHFHLFVRIRTTEEQALAGQKSDFLEKSDFSALDPTEQFRRLFISYAKAINRAYDRTGSLFQHRFGRIAVEGWRQFVALVRYIHRNPQRHGLIEDFRKWPYSSYRAIVSRGSTRVERRGVLEAFGDLGSFIESHKAPVRESELAGVIEAAEQV